MNLKIVSEPLFSKISIRALAPLALHKATSPFRTCHLPQVTYKVPQSNNIQDTHTFNGYRKNCWQSQEFSVFICAPDENKIIIYGWGECTPVIVVIVSSLVVGGCKKLWCEKQFPKWAAFVWALGFRINCLSNKFLF